MFGDPGFLKPNPSFSESENLSMFNFQNLLDKLDPEYL